MNRTIDLPRQPDRGACDPQIQEEPVEFPTEVPEPVEMPEPAPMPFYVPEKALR